MPIYAAQNSPNTRNWQSLDHIEIAKIASIIAPPIIQEFKNAFPQRPGLKRISKKRLDRLYTDLCSALATYHAGIKLEIEENSSTKHKEYESTISIFESIHKLSLKIHEDHVYLFESYCRKNSDDHFLSRKGQEEIADFIRFLKYLIRIPPGRRSNYAVNHTAGICISLVEKFIGVDFPKTIGTAKGDFTTKEAKMVFFILKQIEGNITSSMAHTALKHAVPWRKNLA